MNEKIDYDLIEVEPIVDNDVECEDSLIRLADIIMFCKNPYTYCHQKSVPIPVFDKSLTFDEEMSLAKSVFEDVKVNEIEALDPITGLSAIHYAAYSGTCSALIIASERGANLNIGTKKGMRPMHLAVVNQQVQAVKTLIERGADVRIANNQNDTPLHIACIHDNIEILESLLKRGKGEMELEHEDQLLTQDLFQAVNSQGNTPISVAVLNGQCKAVKLFVSIATENVAGAGFTDIKGNTLLHLAASRGDREMVKTLIEVCSRTIKIDAKNKEGKRAFDLAHEKFFCHCCEIIEETRKKLEKEDELNEKCFTENLLQEDLMNPFKELWVHIDLKGAPPRQEFYKKLFELLKENEVTGILLEVEDMIDFTGIYSCIRRENYYTDEQLQWIIQEAEDSHMQVIPLIQCFGHLEFLLKHKEFAMLREEPNSYFNLCPSYPDAVKIITGYIAQVLSKFPYAKYLHIGADEIFLLGACPDCKLFLIENSRNSLYFNHINKIIKKVKEIRPLEILIWDDMIRGWSKDELKATLGPLAYLCIWYYHDKCQEHKLGVTDGYINTMKQSFNKLWCVSAYKGAAQINAHCTPLLNRLRNQSYWLEKARTHDCFEGIILTGWSRFCHQLVLCEISPVSIHALAICLKVVRDNDINLRNVYKELTKLGLNGKNVLRSHEQILIEEGRDGLLKAELFHMKEEVKGVDLSWCNDCYEMSWELEKARILYKYIKKEAQQYVHLNYAVESKSHVKRDGIFRKKSYDSISNPLEEVHPTFILPKDRRYNIKQRKEIIQTIQQCLSIVTKEEIRADTILGKWMYTSDILDFKNVTPNLTI